MKIFFTKKFREVLEKPYKQIQLGKYKLRGGEDVGFSKLTSENVTSREFLSASSPTSFGGENYYTSQLVRYNGGLQISLEIPETDASIYEVNSSNESYYQIFLFYFTDVTKVSEASSSSLAFLIFENFDGKVFSGLDISSRRNIITTPPFNWKCNFILEQSDYTKILENEWGQELTKVTALEKDKKYTEEDEYISVDSWSKFWVDKISTEGDLDWIETVYLNNFGLKIY